MSRGRVIALVGVLGLIGIGILVWQMLPRDDPARATVGEALEEFRQSGAAGEGPGGAQLGVYRYRTRGSETGGTNFLSSTHEYDGISLITLTRAPCGVLERWQVLSARWSEAEFCVPPEGTGLQALTEFHEFFGRSSEDRYRCSGNTPSTRKLRQVGTRFSTLCESKAGTADSETRVVAIEKVTVGGERIDAVHTVSDVVLEGDVTGTSTRDDWRRRSDGLLLRREVDADAKRTGAIDADYTEQYTIELLSLDPQR